MTAVVETGTFIDEAAIDEALHSASTKDAVRVREILAKAKELDGLSMDEVAVLSSVSDPELLAELFATARECKEAIYGQRLVLFAPLYISNLCNNDCLYCAFRVRNKELHRRALTQAEIRGEVEALVDQGHKRLLLVAGESYPKDGGFQYVLDSIATIYDVKRGNGEIRRVNVNVAPLPVDQFRELKASGIGTFQLFQETYHRDTYHAVHVGGKKKDFDWRVTGMHRAMEAGVEQDRTSRRGGILVSEGLGVLAPGVGRLLHAGGGCLRQPRAQTTGRQVDVAVFCDRKASIGSGLKTCSHTTMRAFRRR